MIGQGALSTADQSAHQLGWLPRSLTTVHALPLQVPWLPDRLFGDAQSLLADLSKGVLRKSTAASQGIASGAMVLLLTGVARGTARLHLQLKVKFGRVNSLHATLPRSVADKKIDSMQYVFCQAKANDSSPVGCIYSRYRYKQPKQIDLQVYMSHVRHCCCQTADAARHMAISLIAC